MILEQTYYNMQCDCCKSMIDEFNWCDEKQDITNIAKYELDWKHLGGKDYCPKCWYYDPVIKKIITGDNKEWECKEEE